MKKPRQFFLVRKMTKNTMSFRIFQVDAFTNQSFSGNPAAVCIMPEPQSEDWMQQVAAEMNLSETAFLSATPLAYHLQWFTPVAEVDLCGHATLASAHVLWEEKEVPLSSAIQFQTRSGILTVLKKGRSIEMNFPAEDVWPAEAPSALLEALGTEAVFTGKTRSDYLIEIKSEAELGMLRPDFQLLATVSTRGVIVTSPSSRPDVDFVSRFFAPRYGILEDPVTGSSHCALGPYWQKRFPKDELTAYQMSKRGGVLRIRPDQDRVLIGGEAVTVLKGMLLSLAAILWGLI